MRVNIIALGFDKVVMIFCLFWLSRIFGPDIRIFWLSLHVSTS